MKRALLFGILSAVFVFPTIAQTLDPCGTVPHRSEWLANFQKRGIDLSQRSVDFRIAINAHQVGNDQGSLFDYGLILESLAALERDFDSTGIGFVVNLPFDTLRSTQYNSHDDVLEGADMMFENNKPDALNIYYVSNPAGNCGYNLPYAGIAMANQCSGFSQKTIAHEVGHALSLPHPFLGWEGGQTDDGSTPAVYTSPAPRNVTYDYTYFQSTLVRDTLIIDTAIVELVARTNCRDAADGFCDTPADYLATRWTCATNNESGQTQMDPDGQIFRSDGTLIMGYSDDNCQSRFTDEQKVAMEAFAQAERPSWIRTTFDTNLVRGVSDLILDADGFTLTTEELTFTPVENATHYFVEVSERRSFSSLLLETVVTSPVLALPSSIFEENENYYIKIYAFNDHSFLAGRSSIMDFTVLQGVSSTQTASVSKLSISPNPVSAGASVQVPFRKDIERVHWYDSRGAIVAEQAYLNNTSVEVPANFATGVYNLMLLSRDGDRYLARVQVIR